LCVEDGDLTRPVAAPSTRPLPEVHASVHQATRVTQETAQSEQDPLLVIVILEMGEHDAGRFDIAVGSARPGLRRIQAVRD
jgi:hypothetical protein